MSALAPRNSYRIADEQEWVESSDNGDLSPASVWAPDYEEEDETTLQTIFTTIRDGIVEYLASA